MRLLLAAAVWVACVGGVALFMARRESRAPAASYAARPATGKFSVEVTASFDVEVDPFGLVTDDTPAAGLIVRVNGVEVLRRKDGVRAGAPVAVESVAAVIVGTNELYVEAHPPQDAVGRAHALRVRVFRDGQPVAERTLWSEPGTPVSGTFSLEIAEAAGAPEDRHDH